MLKVQRRGPVVGEVVGHLARGTRSPSPDVAVHGGIEGVAADDVMHMGGGEGAGLGGGIQALEG